MLGLRLGRNVGPRTLSAKHSCRLVPRKGPRTWVQPTFKIRALPTWSLSGPNSCSRPARRMAAEMGFYWGIWSRGLIVDHGLFLICRS